MRVILVPPAVLAELKHPFAPKPVLDWAVNAPAWMEVVNPKYSLIAFSSIRVDTGTADTRMDGTFPRRTHLSAS